MLYIHSLGHFFPENIIDNTFLTALDIGADPQWALDRVGIRERRTHLSLDYIQKTHNQNPRKAAEFAQYTATQMGKKATDIALERANLVVDDIGMVIAGSCSPEYALPAEACLVANALGLTVPAFDVSSACSTFATQIHFLNSMQAEALADYILLVIPENWTYTIDYRDRRTAVLIGDCAVAAIVSTCIKSPCCVQYSAMQSTPSGWDKVRTPVGQHFYQEGRVVQRFAIKKTIDMMRQMQETVGFDRENIYFIGHQANLVMLKSICKRLDIQPGKHLYNVDQYGNCGAASAPSVLSQHWDSFKAGDELALVAVGSGLTWGGMVLNFRSTHED